MRKFASQIMVLNAQWVSFAKAHHYDRSPVYTKESYLKSAPLSQRALKLRLVLEAADAFYKRKERDSMMYEDDLSYLVGKYQDCRQRKVDYDRYFVLATRYGCFDELEFFKDTTPGFRYWKKVTIAAVRFQKRWIKYWSYEKIKRYLSARGDNFVHYIVAFSRSSLHPILLL